VQQLFELQTRILCDIQPPGPTDGVFLFAQTADNQVSVFESARRLLEQGLTAKILFSQTGARSGYPGYAAWKEQLLARQIKESQIQGVPIGPTASLNTLVEAEALVRFVKQQAFGSLFVAAAPFHQMRAFMTAVTAANRDYPRLRLYSHPGAVLPWAQTVSHSQGTTRGARSELLQAELERIEKYQKKGDLASFNEVLTYLNRRDAEARAS